MGIYDEDRFSFPTVNVSARQLKWPLLAIVLLIVVVGGLFTVAELLKPKPLLLSLEPNPLDMAEQPGSYLKVWVLNMTEKDVSGGFVKVEELGSDRLVIFPVSREIGPMAAGMREELGLFVIRPNPGKEVNSGSYKLRVSIFMDNEFIGEEELTLELKVV